MECFSSCLTAHTRWNVAPLSHARVRHSPIFLAAHRLAVAVVLMSLMVLPLQLLDHALCLLFMLLLAAEQLLPIAVNRLAEVNKELCEMENTSPPVG